MSENRKRGISPEKFYGRPTALQVRIEATLKKQQKVNPEVKPKSCLQGPSRTWLVFKKQKDAIDCCLKRRNGLMCFAFEQDDGTRLFMVAHPAIVWNMDCQRPNNKRRSYEIIQEHCISKLYFDIEFDIDCNSQLDGNKMLKNFLSFVNHRLKTKFNINCEVDNILDLDSTSPSKYSHHIIYQLQNAAFHNNYTVGNFVKFVCNELKDAHTKSVLGDGSHLKKLSEELNLKEEEILELFIKDAKGLTKLFVDEGVYTKNRHFRILGSSKVSKNIPLVVSSQNLYQPQGDTQNYNLNLFLDSLITHFRTEVTQILEFEGTEAVKTGIKYNNPSNRVVGYASSAYPQLDAFIKNLISPHGAIRRIISYSSSCKIVYDVQGYRYCHNIQREHKSNNIKFIVDIDQLVYYQKCYDPDCSDFRSPDFPLPPDVRFFFEDDPVLMNDSVLSSEFFDDDAKFKEFLNCDNENQFPMELGISDNDLCEIVNSIEDASNAVW